VKVIRSFQHKGLEAFFRTGKLKGYWFVSVSGNWRLIFRFQGPDAELVDYLDYH
jgi:plasmid maintenance system killer protein